jgi:hypothetical protein
MSKYMSPRDSRMEDRHVGGRFKAGLLAPVMAHKLKGSEAGLLTQQVFWDLDYIPGRLLSPIIGQVYSVFVPVQAMHALKNPSADYPGSDDVIRAELAAGNSLFDLEAEGEISKRLGVNPRSISGTKSVNEAARLAYICAVNMLRQRRFVNATLLDNSETAMAPAILAQTVLDRLNAVLDPEDRVNGAVSLNAQIPVQGIYRGLADQTGNFFDTNDETVTAEALTEPRPLYLENDAATFPQIYAELGTEVSLTDFYQAERTDRLTREMRALVDKYPERGEEIITRWAMGLRMDIGRDPVVLYEKEITLAGSVQRATDGANLGLERTYPGNSLEFTVPVPATEFGGVVVTLMVTRPDEVLSSQPHPFLTETWTQDNFAADELVIDPVPITIRELDSDCDTGDEDTVAIYGGNHGLKKFYRQYGWNRHLDTNDVDAETAIWQLEVPMSVTPENVNYPDPLPQTPFADTTAETTTYAIKSAFAVRTPQIFGPTPIEELAEIEDADIFEDA